MVNAAGFSSLAKTAGRRRSLLKGAPPFFHPTVGYRAFFWIASISDDFGIFLQ